MNIQQARRDRYRKLARELGYRSRAAFKLIQADRKYKFLKNGMRVLDLGCYPGSWLQVASQKVGKEGFVLGIDVRKVEFVAGNVKTIASDIYDKRLKDKILQITKEKFDVVLSDIAPNTSGVWELDHNRQVDMSFVSLELASYFLKEDGVALFKLFEGDRVSEFLSSASSYFAYCTIFKPEASRKESSELYVFCKGFKREASLTNDRNSP